jgi:hypothetical protein
MPGSHHPGSVVDIQTDVVAVDETRLPRVDPDPHRNPISVRPGICCERLLPLRSSDDRLLRRGERDEERIPCRVDLIAAVSLKHLPQQPMMNREEIRVTLTGARKQPRRSFDIREQQGDGAFRCSGHAPTLRRPRPDHNRPDHNLVLSVTGLTVVPSCA